MDQDANQHVETTRSASGTASVLRPIERVHIGMGPSECFSLSPRRGPPSVARNLVVDSGRNESQIRQSSVRLYWTTVQLDFAGCAVNTVWFGERFVAEVSVA